MKKTIALVMALCLVLALFAGCAGGNGDSNTPATNAPADNNTPATNAPADDGGDVPADGDKVVKIGVFEPASGDNGAGGKQEMLGMQYAHSLTPTVEIGGETYTVELVYADNQSANDKAPTAAQNLVSAGVSIVLGSYGSGVSIAASDVFGDAGVPAVGVTCTNPQVTAGNSHYFRICFLDPFQGTVLANFAKEQFSATKAYCLAKLGDDYSVGLCNYFMQAFGEDNCVYETFPEGNSDFSSYVTNAKNAGCDVFFAPVSTEAAALIIDQAATQALGIPMLAGDTWDSNVIIEAAQGKDIELYVTTFYQEGGDPTFDEGIKAWINSDPTNLANNGGNDMIAAVSAMGYDAYYVALEALKAAGSTNPADVMAALGGVTYEGVSGAIAFDDVNGDAIRDVAYVKYCNTETGAWDFVTVQGIA
jgi:branched-chain amino acid transport system substrate-binding protein